MVEARTGIRRAAKLFFPHRNVGDRTARIYAQKIERLRKCPIVIQYHHSETIYHLGFRASCLISELVEGEILSAFVARQRGKRLPPFEALHLLYALSSGVEHIHAARDYHGDLHDDNVLVTRRGVFFEVKDRYIKEPYPAWTAIGVSALARRKGLAEIRVIASRG